MSEQAEQVYQSFLVRCWLILPVTADEPPTWRFELREVTAESQKHRFSDLEQLKAFMAAKLAAIAASSKQDNHIGENRKGNNP
ncbi:MAG: hypothetical protein ACE5E7_08280 [Anaerolineae bacterium]